VDKMVDLSFFFKKRVFITGHTGFKGAWLCQILLHAGAEVCGYALEPPTDPCLFEQLCLDRNITSITGDIRNLDRLNTAVKKFLPDIVIHMAAQPLVRLSYSQPVMTYETNVMGTVNILEAVRQCGSAKSFLNVTTDKVYRNNEWCYGYREIDELNGFDPYSNSKSCSELVTSSYYNAFFKNSDTAISTVRAGNVIGGGDYALDRVIPDCVRAATETRPVIIRNPYSTRPYQHVLEPLFAYLMIVKEQYHNKALEGSYNVGPDESDCITTGELVSLFCEAYGDGFAWENKYDGGPHEAGFLKLDCSKIKSVLGWKPLWNINKAVRKAVEWYKASGPASYAQITLQQINSYIDDGVMNDV